MYLYEILNQKINMKYEQTDLWPAVLEVESNIYVYFYLIF